MVKGEQVSSVEENVCKFVISQNLNNSEEEMELIDDEGLELED